MLQKRKEHREKYGLTGTPKAGLWTSTLGLFAGLTSIVFYGVAGPEFKESLELSGVLLGLLLSSPHLSKVLLRIPFGAWVDEVGGKKPFLVLLGLTITGMAGLVVILFFTYPDNFNSSLFPALLFFGFLGGAGGATFSVGIPKTSYWFPAEKQGYALGFYAGIGNIGPGIFNFLIPLLVGVWGLTGAYFVWLLFLVVATAIYGYYAVDAWFFQLIDRGMERSRAREVSEDMGQEVFPSGGMRQSLKNSASNYLTWVLVFLYTISFGGGFTALTAWFPTYWYAYHHTGLLIAGLLAAGFTVYGSLIRIPGGSLSDRFGGENVAAVSFTIMMFGGAMLTWSSSFWPAFAGMMVLGTGMGVANAAVFELVPKYVPGAVGGASGWIGGIGGAGTLVILPVLGWFVDVYGQTGYARGFSVFIVLSALCAGISFALKSAGPAGDSR